MLSYPDRHKFEEIRSRWEAAQVSHDNTQLIMVGRKEKPVTHQPSNVDESNNASKFRRKLSHGLSLISLSQRKITPVRPSLPSKDLSNTVNAPHPRQSTKLLYPLRDSDSYGVSTRKVTPDKNMSPHKDVDPEATPKQLSRSRTMSFIPRLSRSESKSSINESDSAPTPPCTLEEEVRATPTKIPSPDVSAPAHRKSSPRQYNSRLTTQQSKHVAAGNAFAGVKNQTSSKPSPVRSYTTPNLVKGPQRPNMKENSTPITHRHGNRLSNIREHSPQSPRREGFTAPTTASKRLSAGPTSALASSKPGSYNTPPASSKRKSSGSVSQTPFAAQRALPNKRSPLHSIGSPPISNVGTVTQTRLLGPVSAPASTKSLQVNPRSTKTLQVTPRVSLPRANTEKDLRKRTYLTPHKRTGGGMAVNKEVRFPRSYVGVEDVPPVPPIPEQYKSVSMPVLVTTHPEETNVQEEESSTTSSHSSDSSVFALPEIPLSQATLYHEARPSKNPRLSSIKSKLSIQIPAPRRTFSASLLFTSKSGGLGSAKTSQVLDVADVGISSQVKDYMPALYWAGRFQSRYDQWRTEATQAELNPEYHMEGPLAHCNVHQEKIAACLIFLQLRELCLSHHAAASLWVSKTTPAVQYLVKSLSTLCYPRMSNTVPKLLAWYCSYDSSNCGFRSSNISIDMTITYLAPRLICLR